MSGVELLKSVVAAITTAVFEVAARKDSGHIEVHFNKGEYVRAFHKKSL